MLTDLCNRYQWTKGKWSFKDWTEISVGVAQGSILCPLLFKLIANILLFITNSHLCNYDDNTLYVILIWHIHVCHTLYVYNIHVIKSNLVFYENHMVPNSGKKNMLIGNYGKPRVRLNFQKWFLNLTDANNRKTGQTCWKRKIIFQSIYYIA